MKNHISVLGISLFLFALPSFGQSPAPAETEMSYARQLVRENGEWQYIVGPRAPHLYMISRDLYGTENRWKDLARWNNLKEPYQLKPGQKLRLAEAPTTSVEQGNFILSEAWEVRGDNERARRIRVSTSKDTTTTVITETETRTEVVAAAPAAEEIAAQEPAPPAPKRRLRRLPAPPPAPPVEAAPVETPAIITEEPAPPAAPEIAPAPAEEAEHGSHWHFGIKATGSMTEVYQKDRATKTSHTLKTKVDPGVELEAEWKFSESTALLLSGGYETLEIHADHDVHVENEALGVTRFGVGFGYEVNSWIQFSLTGANEQMAFFEDTGHGFAMERADIPQLILGSRWLLKDGVSTKIHGSFQLLTLLPAKVFGEDLRSGFGMGLGLQFTHPFGAGGLTYGLSARTTEQGSEHFEKQQNSAAINLGWVW